MREIKFRAWNIEKKEFVKDNYYNQERVVKLDYQKNYLMRPSIYELSQYTGLKDKNGKEIYEGDIVKVKIIYYADCSKEEILSTEEITGLVCFEAYAFGIISDEWFKPFLYLLNSELEVIGNLYETPELLNDEDVRVLEIEAQVYSK